MATVSVAPLRVVALLIWVVDEAPPVSHSLDMFQSQDFFAQSPNCSQSVFQQMVYAIR